jgi:hypothetical protein
VGLGLTWRSADPRRPGSCAHLADVGDRWQPADSPHLPLWSASSPVHAGWGQHGSDGGVRQPTAEAWSIKVLVARATIGRVSSAR